MAKASAAVTPSVPEADQAPVPSFDHPLAPSVVRVLDEAGFIDDHGDRWHWQAGAVVRNPYVIELLDAHCVAVETVEE
jgi:hypothetical protein